MNFDVIFSFITMILIIFAVILKGQMLEKLFYIFVLDLALLILVNRGVSIAFLFTGTIIPLFIRSSHPLSPSLQKKISSKDTKQKIVSYIAFAPLLGLGIMSYRLPQVKIENLSPVMTILGEVSLFVVTLLVIMPKRIKFK